MDIFFNTIGWIVCIGACTYFAVIFISCVIREMYIGIRKKWDKKLYARIKREVETPYIIDKFKADVAAKQNDSNMEAMEMAYKRIIDELSMKLYGKPYDDYMDEEFKRQFTICRMDLSVPKWMRSK